MDNIQAVYDAMHSLQKELMGAQCTISALKGDVSQMSDRTVSLVQQLDHMTRQYEGAMEECASRGRLIFDLKDELATLKFEMKMGHPRSRGERMVRRGIDAIFGEANVAPITGPHLDLTRNGEGVEIDARGLEFPLGSPRVQKKQRPTDVLAPATPEPEEITPIRVIHPAAVQAPRKSKESARMSTGGIASRVARGKLPVPNFKK